MVKDDMLFKFSFKYKQSEKYSFRMLFVYFNQAINLVKRKKSIVEINSNQLIFDLFDKASQERIDYLKTITNNSRLNFISKESLYFEYSLALKVVEVIHIMLVLALTLMKWITIQNSNVAAFTLEVTELRALENFIKRNKIKHIYFFSPFEKDTTFISYYLMRKHNVYIQWIPSANPILNFYNNIICDEFTFTMPYHKFEFERLNRSSLCKNTTLWPPFGFNEILKTTNRETPRYSLGLISSGNWLRRQLGHNEDETGFYVAEENLLIFLQRFMSENKHIKLVISLHPLEKRNSANLASSRKFYESYFNEIEIEYAPENIPTKSIPQYFDIGISAYSSACFERLFAGYKTFFSQKGIRENYFPDESLKNITLNTYEEFSKNITASFEISNIEFFQKYGLVEYKYDFYDLQPTP